MKSKSISEQDVPNKKRQSIRKVNKLEIKSPNNEMVNYDNVSTIDSNDPNFDFVKIQQPDPARKKSYVIDTDR